MPTKIVSFARLFVYELEHDNLRDDEGRDFSWPDWYPSIVHEEGFDRLEFCKRPVQA